MASIRCPNCGKDNPDLLDVCQFCQTPLKPDSALRSGQTPTKKNTGELEPKLPDWLKDMRQQARDSAEEDAAQAAAQPGAAKDEPPDLLAGLASQSGSAGDEDVPDWLASLTAADKPRPSPTSTPDSGTDFFAQFNQSESKPQAADESPQENAPFSFESMRDQSPAHEEKDELSAWFSQAADQPEEVAGLDPDRAPGDSDWSTNFDSAPASAQESAPKEEEDLSWLHNLEAAAKQTGDLQSPKKKMDWTADFETPSTPSQGSASQDDLSWLDRLGGIEETAQPEQQPEQPASSRDDLGWLNQFGGSSEPGQPSQPAASKDELSWLDNLGGTSEPQPFDAAPSQPILSQPFASAGELDWLKSDTQESGEPDQPAGEASDKTAPEDLSWLNDLGKPAQTSEPAAAHEDLRWLNELGGEPEPLSTPPFSEPGSETENVSPRHTAPLGQQEQKEPEPDWLKSATEAPTMPPPGDLSMDWFSGTDQPREQTPPPAPQTAPFDADISSKQDEPASLSNQDVDSLFSVEMPDWLSRPDPGTAEPVAQQTGAAPAEEDESLAPVDLPSWVQAMRPVEAVISETTSGVADQPAETEGPLAGLHSVIPIAPIGSSRRPKAVSLTLQVSDEQQSSVALLEQILGSETSPRALITPSFVVSQHWLRWALSGVFLLVLTAAIFLRSQMMPVSAVLPQEASGLSNTVIGIPAGAKVLVVIDYEPSLAGEMEAISAPLLDQIILLSRPSLSFISTSPSGVALAERLLTNINQAGAQYANLGYLPGGSAGVLGFIEAPGQIMPLADVQLFSEYSALIVLTDHAESGRVWVEQLQGRKQIDPALTNQPLLMVASAQAGPLLQPYVSSGQVTAMLSGLSDAARYEFVNNNRPGIARSYWDTFGIGLTMAIALIVLGSLWSLFTGIRARRTSAEQG